MPIAVYQWEKLRDFIKKHSRCLKMGACRGFGCSTPQRYVCFWYCYDRWSLPLCEWEKTKYGFGDTGVSHRPLGWELSHRGDASAKKLISRIDIGTCSFVTDEWGSFFRLLPEGRHFYGKDLNFPIKGRERSNNHTRQVKDLYLIILQHWV